jgi:hypothetical protein
MVLILLLAAALAPVIAFGAYITVNVYHCIADYDRAYEAERVAEVDWLTKHDTRQARPHMHWE